MTTPQTKSQAAPETVSEPRTVMTRRNRRTRTAVKTVLGSRHGIAACTDNRDLFDAAENYSPAPAIRTEAAAICDTCPLKASCGFRVTTRTLSGASS
ncbi:hypothetical protein [Streptomyces albipurpureus]|uniref:4Fe-4S Wbl-type domain-containing protein n=1 Tax=Streptomyces albipurpureus TaxID=2897419 RepID=A0ABT0V4T5_9ACTN|nr:hypothetical protein [Streptomyces sp. CWNU-1]MCM2394391.1 hypothetical protein [Streptomyces sp. CWNU-1]